MKLILSLLMLCSISFANVINLTEANSINFNSKFDGRFVAKKQIEAANKCYTNEGSDIYVVLYTPGGSVSAGQLFFDTLKGLPCNFHTITIFAASMGYQTVQNLGKRHIISSGVLMSHRASLSGVRGELGGELDSVVNFFKQSVKELEVIASNRVGITLEDYKKAISDELWMTGSQAVELNHADEIALVRCDKNFSGSYTQLFRSIFGSVEVEFSNCPLIVAPLAVRSTNEKVIEEVLDFYNNIHNHVTLEL